MPPDEEVYLIEEKHHLTERLLAHQQGRSVHYEHQPTPSNGWVNHMDTRATNLKEPNE